MCDSLVSMSDNNSDRSITFFAKNSDREPGEMQIVEHYPRSIKSGTVKCTYVDVAFEGESNAIVISRPYWMWGAEMGVNEHGVAVGNEALFTKRNFEKKGLLGMDLLRLGLEKGKTAMETLETIVRYLEEYGQGGSNSVNKIEYYDNSFLIADRRETYILETSGKKWRSAKIERAGSISNAIAIKEKQNFDIRPDFLYTYFGRGHERAEITQKMLERGNIKLEDIMEIMRFHNSEFSPRKGSNRDICMHDGPLTRKFQTANSMIAELGAKLLLVWFTHSPNPCLSLYKPFFLGVEEARYGKDYWQNAENLHRVMNKLKSREYKIAMAETLSSQMQINELVRGVRDIMAKNEKLETAIITRIYEQVQVIDAQHLESLKALL